MATAKQLRQSRLTADMEFYSFGNKNDRTRYITHTKLKTKRRKRIKRKLRRKSRRKVEN